MRQSFSLAAVLVALALVFPLGASAGPQWARIPPGTITFDAAPGLICPEAVGRVITTYLGGNQSTVVRRGGRVMMVMGTAQVEVKSLRTGKSVVLETTGIGGSSPDGTALHASGKNIWFFLKGDAGPGDQATARDLYFVGTQDMLLAADGTAIDFSYSGQIVLDVCDALSPS